MFTFVSISQLISPNIWTQLVVDSRLSQWSVCLLSCSFYLCHFCDFFIHIYSGLYDIYGRVIR